jgi:dipeptidyl aminopeptidase/acylaminoacyl peptidase
MPHLLIAALAAAAVQATPASMHQYEHLALSPGGDRVAAVESDELAQSMTEAHGSVVLRGADGTVLGRFDPCGTCRYYDPAFSPDGRSVAFTARDPRTGQASIQVIEDGKLRVAAQFDGLLAQPRYSPDGRAIAVLATASPHKESGATQAGAARVGEIGRSYDERRIAVVPASGGQVGFISPDDTFVYEYDWTPDGDGFVATAAKGDGDNNWWIARLSAVDLKTGLLRELAAPSFQMNAPRVSPDGKTVAVIGGLMSDFQVVGGDLYTVPLKGGALTNRTPGFKGSFSGLAWRTSGLYATALIGETNTLLRVDPETGSAQPLWGQPMRLLAGDGRVVLSADGSRMAAVAESYAAPPAIVTGPVAAPVTVTHDNDAATQYATARSVTWKNEGFDVQGWLLAPLKVEPGKTYPMVVNVHGGPSSAHQPNFIWKGPVRGLLDHGYYVFMPNPRGSFGQGEAFTRANVQDFGGGDLRDILAGIDAVEKVAPIDERRLGVYGHSYGGFMSMWTVTHSQRFHAAVAGAGIANWLSYYGQNGIDQWMVPFFGATAYDDPTAYDRLSPIRSIKNAKTPTFIYVGERDVETPAAQSLEFWHGMEAVGAPNSLVIYEGEGHGIRKPAHNLDLNRRVVDWFDKYLGRP